MVQTRGVESVGKDGAVMTNPVMLVLLTCLTNESVCLFADYWLSY